MTSDGYQVQEFAADRVNSAFHWLLSQLDTNGNGFYDPNAATNPDISRKIEIFGHSWGGISVSFLCNAIRTSMWFKSKEVYIALEMDPVNIMRSGDGRIRSNVDYFYDFHQTNPHGDVGVPIIQPNITGIRVDSDAYISVYDNLFTNMHTDIPGDFNVNHFSIIYDLLPYVEQILEGHPIL